MKLLLKTRVRGHFREVYDQFDKSLLQRLEPPGMKVVLHRYDEPMVPGAWVELETKVLGLISQSWRVQIDEVHQGESEAFFVDVGRQLPFPLKSWRHKHLIRDAGKDASGNAVAEIVDDVEFSAGWLSALFYPVVYLQFAWRRPQYRAVFGKPEA